MQTNKPEIEIVGGELPRVVRQSEDALIRSGFGVFRRGDILQRPIQYEGKQVDLTALDTNWLVLKLTEVVKYKKYDKRTEDYKYVDCPKSVADTYLANSGSWRVPELIGISETPSINLDGKLVFNPGYDSSSKILFVFEDNWQKIAETPDHQDAIEALRNLQHPFHKFPFVSEADLAVIVSVIVSGIVGPKIKNYPLHATTAPVAGSGKSKSLDMASVLLTGRTASALNWGNNSEESEKRLGSSFLAGERFILIDNIEHPLSGELLCSALTQDTVSLRPLGKSQIIKIPTSAIITASGNNLIIKGDLNRRTLICSLDPKVERPELRIFDFNPVEYVTEHRVRLVNSALTILKAHSLAGYPQMNLTALGSFEQWSRFVRAAIVWAGSEDPCKVMERTRQKDPEIERLTELLDVWKTRFGHKEHGVRHVINEAKMSYAKDSKLLESIESISGNGDQARCLGNYLSKNEGRLINNFCFKRKGTKDGSTLWAVEAGLGGCMGF